MLSLRVIPCLLLRGSGLVKTEKFKGGKYIGDPVNAIRIFNEKEVDELVLLDIAASREGRAPSFAKIEEVASECFMPLAYGGGIRTVQEAARILKLGVEKVIFNTTAWRSPQVLTDAAREFGAQAVVASIDVRRRMFGRFEVMVEAGTRATGIDPVEYARRMETAGAGEILLTSIDRDGTMSGYDLELVSAVSGAVGIPVIASGGAGSVQDFAAARRSGAAAVAAGAMFVFQGPHRAVLITYPGPGELARALG
ncbi:MAG: AglZ/HisF2 family acetamidino modification protein [Rubrivivax sp.]|nr:AglZ/HisF2 family acetamidino modification protein [Rubrivivax sp.]